MATAKRTTVTLRNSRRRKTLPFAPLAAAVPNLLAGFGAASATSCGANFRFPSPTTTTTTPTTDGKLLHLDAVDITYRSDLADPRLSCWCGVPGRAIEKLSLGHVASLKGSTSVLLDFLSDEPCWFDLSSDLDDCRDRSETFFVSSYRRILLGQPTTADDAPSRNPLESLKRSTTILPLTPRNTAAVDSRRIVARGDSFSAGAIAALGVGIALTCTVIGAMAAFLYFRRRRRARDAEASGGISDSDRRGKRRGAEKKRNGAASEASGRSDEPLCPIQPVFDGFPGSMGYEDVRSLHSTVQSNSPGGQSPTNSYTGNYWTNDRSIEREELTAARLKSQLQPSSQIVVSYGPNPVTPTLNPRSSSHLAVTSTTTPISPKHNDHSPMIPLSDYADYTAYDPKPSPPRPSPAPIVVSYGPNKVTPTPLVVSPTVPPDESIVNRRLHQQESVSAISHERQFSWEADSPLLGASSMGPLPPYATTEDFEAMEKGAVRKLAEPMAQAELPPTKDGFYHYSTAVVEYELPGGYGQGGGGGGGGGGNNGGGGGGNYGLGPRGREIDEQKFLLDDGEFARMREQKARIRAAAAAAAAGGTTTTGHGLGEGEEYDLGEVGGRRR